MIVNFFLSSSKCDKKSSLYRFLFRRLHTAVGDTGMPLPRPFQRPTSSPPAPLVLMSPLSRRREAEWIMIRLGLFELLFLVEALGHQVLFFHLRLWQQPPPF